MATTKTEVIKGARDPLERQHDEYHYRLLIAESKIPGAGSGVYAGEDIPAGKEIFRARPSVAVVQTTDLACDNCFKLHGVLDGPNKTVKLRACSCCKLVKYCSTACQRVAFVTYHKWECPMYATMTEANQLALNFRPHYRLLIRLIIKHEQNKLQYGEWDAILALKSNTDKLIKRKAYLEGVERDLKRIKSLTKCDLSEETLNKLFWRTTVNSFAAVMLPDENLGICLDPVAAMFNHSCDPNTIWGHRGPKLTFRSRRAIKKDEEVTAPYIITSLSLDQRRAQLSKAYAFHCCCPRCQLGSKDPIEILTDNDEGNVAMRKTRIKLVRLMHKSKELLQDPEEIEKAMHQICKECENIKPWPISAYPVPTLYEEMVKLHKQRAQFERAVKLMVKIVYLIDPLRFPEQLDPPRVKNLSELLDLLQMIFPLQMAKLHPEANPGLCDGNSDLTLVTTVLTPFWVADLRMLSKASFGTDGHLKWADKELKEYAEIALKGENAYLRPHFADMLQMTATKTEDIDPKLMNMAIHDLRFYNEVQKLWAKKKWCQQRLLELAEVDLKKHTV